MILFKSPVSWNGMQIAEALVKQRKKNNKMMVIWVSNDQYHRESLPKNLELHLELQSYSFMQHLLLSLIINH